ncbi:cell division protein FtsQ/DivIB [Enterococcus sp. LJL98]
MSEHDKERKQSFSADEKNDTLTPWQKEHLLYLESEGIQKDAELEEEVRLEESVEEEQVIEQEEERPRTSFSFSDHLPNFTAYRNQKLRKRLLFIVSLYLIPLFGSLYYISPLNRLSAVVVTGKRMTPEEKIIQSAPFVVDERLWPQFFKRQQVAEAIVLENPRVKSATIGLQEWNELKISVNEYEEVAYLVRGNQYLPILEDGTILQEEKKEVTENRVILESFVEGPLILETIEAYQSLPSEIQDAISQIKYAPSKKNKELVTLFMNDGNQVHVGVSKLASQMKYYLQVAKEMEEKGVIDMEVGIFSYPYSLKEEEKNEKTSSSESF